jgi:hypothetical protein
VPRSYAIPPEEKSEQAIPVSPDATDEDTEGHIRGRAIPEQPEPEGIRGRLTEPTDDEKPGPDEAFRYKG